MKTDPPDFQYWREQRLSADQSCCSIEFFKCFHSDDEQGGWVYRWGGGVGSSNIHHFIPLIIIIGSMIFIPQNPKWRSRGRCDGQLWSSLCWKSPGENNFFRTEKKKKIDCWPGPHLLGVEGEGGRRWKRDFLKASSEKLLLLKVNALLTLLSQVFGQPAT